MALSRVLPLAAPVLLCAAASAQTYDYEEIVVPGSLGSSPAGLALNDLGEVSGRFLTIQGGDNDGPFLWRAGAFLELPLPPLGSRTATASALSNTRDLEAAFASGLPPLQGDGWIAGGMDYPVSDQFLFWEPLPASTSLAFHMFTPELPVGLADSTRVDAVNDRGSWVGTANITMVPPPGENRAYYKQAIGQIENLAELLNSEEIECDDLNHSETILGTFDPRELVAPSGFLLDGNNLSTPFIALPDGGPSGVLIPNPAALNEADLIVGTGFENVPLSRGTAYYAEAANGWIPNSLPGPGSDDWTGALDVNDRYPDTGGVPQVAGWWSSSMGAVRLAMVWNDTSPMDLGTVASAQAEIRNWPPPGRSILLYEAVAINELGQVLVVGEDTSPGTDDRVTFLLSPIGPTQSGLLPPVSGGAAMMACRGLGVPGDEVHVFAGLGSAQPGITVLPGGLQIPIASAVWVTQGANSIRSGLGGLTTAAVQVPDSLGGSTLYTQFVNFTQGTLSPVRVQEIR